MTDLTSFQVTDLVTDNLALYHNRLLGGNLRAEFVNTETISATKSLVDDDCPFQVLDGGAADREVDLAAEATTNHVTIIYNAGSTNNLTVMDDSGSTSYIVLSPGAWVMTLPISGVGWKIISTSTMLTATLYGPAGFANNYVITRSISSNDLLVELKTIAGSDASSADKITARIGDALRSVTSALSVTVTHGTNIFNAGSTELAASSIDLFVYLGWRASDSSVFIGLSRIPYGRTYADFSGTSTNETYLAYSGSAPASTDSVEVIGRVSCQNSGIASYNWSVVTDVIVNRPIYETRWLNYTPAGLGTTPSYSSISVTVAKYILSHRRMDVELIVSGTLGGSAGSLVSISYPFTPAQVANNPMMGLSALSNAVSAFGNMLAYSTNSSFAVRKYDYSNFPTSGTLVVNATGFCEI